MSLTFHEKEIRKIVRKTTEKMKVLGTYRPQFDSVIRTYSEMKYELMMLTNEFYENGCKRTEEYTNKNGSTNIRKTASYLALEKLRDDVDKRENNLGLTPTGLKRINDEMKKKSGTNNGSSLDKFLSQNGG